MTPKAICGKYGSGASWCGRQIGLLPGALYLAGEELRLRIADCTEKRGGDRMELRLFPLPLPAPIGEGVSKNPSPVFLPHANGA